MEQELFTWTEWDGEPDCMTFYNVELLKPIGKFPKGTKFNSAVIMQGGSVVGGILQLFDRESSNKLVLMGEFKLHYIVGDAIK